MAGEPLLAAVFECDRARHCLRLAAAALPGLAAAVAHFPQTGRPIPPAGPLPKPHEGPQVTGAAGVLVFPCPPGARPGDPVRLSLRFEDGRELAWEGSLDQLRDATPTRLSVSRLDYDAARGHLVVSGWAAGLPGGAVVTLFARGRRLARLETGQPRPNLIAQRGLLPLRSGMIATVALPRVKGVADTLELRATDRSGQVLAVLPLTPPTGLTDDPSGMPEPLLPRLRARAEAMPRERLERLVASEPFRRRWQRPEGEVAPHPCLLAREAVTAALAARLAPGEEIAVRLVDGDRVLCRPIDDSILARRYLFEGQDEIGFLRWLGERVGPGDCAIDAGAAYGVMSRTMARRGAHVIAVEADPLAADRIRRAGLLHGKGRIELVEMALAAAPGEVVFAGMGGSAAGSGKVLTDDRPATLKAFLAEISTLNQVPLSATGGQVKVQRRFGKDDVDFRRVPAVTLDGLCARFGLRDVAVVKVDIEGGELEALRGASGLLDGAFGTPPVVAFEYSALFPTRGGQREEILSLFWARGWRIWRLDGGKSRGGAAVPVTDAATAPRHDNLIAVPPGRESP